ncbi:glycoside hydrolase family 17 protein [Xylariomycetidae sp. FL2044]|nr:glycoside hydrolase family 17 protein [Xylariomycetidae sp. FL2044]
MKSSVAVAAVAAVAGARASNNHHRHAHDIFHLNQRGADNGTCVPGCTTIYSTWYGEATLVFPPVPETPSTSALPSTTAAPEVTSTVVVVPTPIPQTITNTGVYTFPATTVTLTESTTVVAPSVTGVPSGTHTLGGVTTIVTTATTVTCPYATISTSEGVVTSIIATTEYVCPSAGTYTIAPITTTVPADTTVTVPVATSYPPGTYTQPEVVTTITETSTVIYCPFDIPTPTSETPVIVAPTTTAIPTTTAVPVPTTSEVATSASSSSSTPQPTGGLGGTPGKPWAITYTAYESDAAGGCKTQSQVEADIAAIAAAGITVVRTYSTDCDTLINVGAAAEAHGVKIILGIYIDSPGCSAGNPSVSEQMAAIKAWGKWSLVDAMVVGNEAAFHAYCTPSELAGLIEQCKSEFSEYTGPYTTAETVGVWQQEDFASAMCGAVDYVGANVHAFFNTETVASQAGVFVKGQLEILDGICPGKEGIIMETGWPTEGNTMGKAVPGVSEQAIAVKAIIEECGDKAVFFNYSADMWKDGSTACACEQHFSCAAPLGITIAS